MTKEQLEEIRERIEKVPDCESLLALRGKLIGQMEAELLNIDNEILKLLKLTNPATFIANMILMIRDSLTEYQLEKIEMGKDIIDILVILRSKALSFENCHI